jgi:chromosome segregation ATPase
LVAAALLWLNRWNIYDSLRLRGYQPPQAITQLATDTTMNDHTRRLFYVYHPALEDKTAFVQSCKLAEKTIVLGCYVPSQGIYLSNITDERLAGVIQVTAAHETLHAAYDRLSDSDKSKVDAMVTSAYSQVTDKRIRETMDAYRKSGADTTNELHSILGTEVRNLPPDLEAYYSRYFKDRKAIVAYSEKYEQAFDERQKAVDSYDQQLATIKGQIDGAEATLASQEATLKTERGRLDALLSAKQYEAYNAGVPGFNAQVAAYNTSVRKIRGLIDQYNDIVNKRNAVALEETELVKAIDSRPETISTQ